ncbi:MAG: excinuclease ABC subunit UvrB [Candidatus Paceibacterota bacterium]|jgi:excinuclease ABC subunit B
MKEKSIFKIDTKLTPAGDQPVAIDAILKGLEKDMDRQTLLGVTGSGKTFTMANVIAKYNKPTLVIAHNKTLAAQLAQEYREFFPNNAVHYFVSYYDFYQPEAYIPVTDTYIEKEAMINEEIDRLRHASTQALLTRKDVIIIASVSCIYGLGSPEEYEKVNLKIESGMNTSRSELIRQLINIHFERTNADLNSGQFRALGNTIEIMPVNDRTIYRIEFDNNFVASSSARRNALVSLRSASRKSPFVAACDGCDKITQIVEIDPITRALRGKHNTVFIFPAKHFISNKDQSKKAFKTIQAELIERLKVLEKEGKLLEAERLKRRVKYDLSMIKEIGYTNGIENYSRHFSGKSQGEPPDTLLSYFPHDKNGKPNFLTIIDESHVTIPQLNGMYAGDASRKETLVEHGFRLPSAKDNRPLKFNEFLERIGPMIFTSATPSDYEMKVSKQVIEQVIRPTGLVDPQIVIKPVTATSLGEANMVPEPSSQAGWRQTLHTTDSPPRKDEGGGVSVIPPPSIVGEGAIFAKPKRRGVYPGQIFDFIEEAEKTIKKGDRVLATTLTKKMAEDLSQFLKEKGMKTAYLHSDIKTIERINILTDFRKGKYDCLVGVNLLREGLDLPEVSLIGILDADKEGFLRSQTALIQTIGRAARNVSGRVILYADNLTGSIRNAVIETDRRRNIQIAHNKKYNITPKTIIKRIHDITDQLRTDHDKAVYELLKIDEEMANTNIDKLIQSKKKQMTEAVKILDFETAALIRDELLALEHHPQFLLP